jgi:RNA polymerase sigma-70 factor (ECF subfamily)
MIESHRTLAGTVQDAGLTSPAALWEQYGRELMRFGTVLVGPADAHDTVIEAFLRASAKIELATVQHPRAYLFRAVVNTAAMQTRARRRRWQRDLHAVVAETASGDHPDVDVQRAVAALSVAQRAVVYLAYWEDLSERAIAEWLGVSHGTVRRHLVRARVQLRKALA